MGRRRLKKIEEDSKTDITAHELIDLLTKLAQKEGQTAKVTIEALDSDDKEYGFDRYGEGYGLMVGKTLVPEVRAYFSHETPNW